MIGICYSSAKQFDVQTSKNNYLYKTCALCFVKIYFTCLELFMPHVGGENRGKWKGWRPPGIEPRTPGLCSRWSATESRQPDNLTILYIYCTGGTKVPQSHTRQLLGMCRQNSIRGRQPILSDFLRLSKHWTKKITQNGFSLDGENFLVDRTVLTSILSSSHVAWIQG